MKIRAGCRLCARFDDSLERALYDMAHMPARDLRTLTSLAGHQADGLSEKAKDIARRRRQEDMRSSGADRAKLSRMRDDLFDNILDILAKGGEGSGLLDSYLNNASRYALEERVAHGDMSRSIVEEKDMLEALGIFADAKLIDVFEGTYRLTPLGCRRLARHILKTILENISPGLPGINPTGDEGFGMSEGFTTRRYEFGDEFSSIDTQATLLSALQGNRAFPIRFKEADIHIRETTVASRIANGLMIDASGSMTGDKLKAARDVCLALSELIGKTGSDILKVYVFSSTVRAIPSWEILNHRFSGATTDITAALRRFRADTRSFHGEKQVYLITDMAPNTENGKYVGFERAAPGVLEEARRCSLNGITVNIIMLDETKSMADLASIMARRNAGRVFFTKPGDLGRVVIEDYLQKTMRRKGRP